MCFPTVWQNFKTKVVLILPLRHRKNNVKHIGIENGLRQNKKCLLPALLTSGIPVGSYVSMDLTDLLTKITSVQSHPFVQPLYFYSR